MVRRPSPVVRLVSNESNSYDAFQSVVNATDLDSPAEETGSVLATANTRATARRLHRTRQRLGSYRHDLLVAMRVVNSIEREVVHSEWENWLVDESVRCDQLKLVLEGEKGKDRAKSKKGAGQKVWQPPMDTSEKREELRKWYDGYCGSCKADYTALVAERRTLPGA